MALVSRQGGEAALIISHTHAFILLAPWKTASSTCHSRLGGYNESSYNRFFHFNENLQRIVHQHVTYSEYLQLPESQLGYLSAAFVRNPYDRVYSGFLQLQRDIANQPKLQTEQPWVKSLMLEQISEAANLLLRADFDFDKWIDRLEDHVFFNVGRNSNMPLHPAHYWTGLRGSIDVDFVGRVEVFETDFARLCARLGVTPSSYENQNVSDQYSAHAPFGQSKYASRMAQATLRKINRIFERDFDLFNYTVLDSTP